MAAKLRTIELESETLERLEACAEERGLSARELVAELVADLQPLAANWESMRSSGRGPWSPQVLAEDARRFAEYEREGEGVPWEEVKAWMESWGTPEEMPPPKPRKL